VPVQQEPIYQAPNNLLPFGFFFRFQRFKYLSPSLCGLFWYRYLLLFIQVVMTSMVWWDLACCSDMPKELDEAWPIYGTLSCIPVLDLKDRVNGELILWLVGTVRIGKKESLNRGLTGAKSYYFLTQQTKAKSTLAG
jgi:hypothetical protein